MAKTKTAKTTKRRRPRARPEWVDLTLEHLEAARTSKGLSKTAWARRLTVSVQAYHAWLAGTNVPTATRQKALVQKLDAPTALSLMQQQCVPGTRVPLAIPERAIPASCLGACPIHCGRRAQLTAEVADTLRVYTLALLEKVEPGEIPALVSKLRESLS